MKNNTTIYTLIFLLVALGLVMALRNYVTLSTPVTDTQTPVEIQDDMSQEIAPVHAEDATYMTTAEEGAANQRLVQAIVRGMEGEWRSSEDAKFSRRFTGEKVVEIYGGKVVSTGTWGVYTKENLYNIPFTADPGVPYLQILTEGNVTLYFKVNKVTPEELELIYIDRGNILRFTKVNK